MISRRFILQWLCWSAALTVMPTQIMADVPVVPVPAIPVDIDIANSFDVEFSTDPLLVQSWERYSMLAPGAD